MLAFGGLGFRGLRREAWRAGTMLDGREKEDLGKGGEGKEYLGMRTRTNRIATHLYPSGSCARAI